MGLFAGIYCLYIPANLYPMMYTASLGANRRVNDSGWGWYYFGKMGSWPIALVIFIASIFIPMAKMFTLAWLYFCAGKRTDDSDAFIAIKHLKLYRLTEFIGRWSMVDIFVVAILVALVQLQKLNGYFTRSCGVMLCNRGDIYNVISHEF